VPSAAGNSGVGRSIRWGARITSIPILALVLISLVPALGDFSISTKADKILAVGLLGTAAGLLVAWRWPGLGGILALLSVGLMLAQGEDSLWLDPFSLAFGLQGLLFLASCLLSSRGVRATTTVAMGWARKTVIALLILCALAGMAVLVHGPGATPVPRDKEAFVGTWDNGTGFMLEITSDGHARVNMLSDGKVDPWNSPVAPGKSGVFLANFSGDNCLELTSGPLGSKKVYHIDRYPSLRGKEVRMVLNGSETARRADGMVLKKRSEAAAFTPPTRK